MYRLLVNITLCANGPAPALASHLAAPVARWRADPPQLLAAILHAPLPLLQLVAASCGQHGTVPMLFLRTGKLHTTRYCQLTHGCRYAPLYQHPYC